MSSDTASKLQQDNAGNSVSESMILNSIARDDEPEESNELVLGTTTTAVKPVIATNVNTAKKAEVSKAPVASKVTKKVAKPKAEKKTEKKTPAKSKVKLDAKPKMTKPKPKLKSTSNDY
jgi:hypothetical protein